MQKLPSFFKEFRVCSSPLRKRFYKIHKITLFLLAISPRSLRPPYQARRSPSAGRNRPSFRPVRWASRSSAPCRA
ncbi:hypothetical protein HMPREF0262_02389 [Clostridium sp. ATCC 29733]|nr:hypothetical protein HMPREF0262_02389 [Clostridium sp. ATCC 29733]